MPFYVKDEETNDLVRKLAKREGVGLTEAVKRAVSAELKRGEAEDVPLRDKLKKIADEIAKFPKTGLKADKAFFDELSGD